MKSTREPRRGAGGRVAGGGAGLPFGRLADHLAWFALALIASAYLATLAERVSGARFQTDECFHASMAQWIASHGTLPRVIHELYSGFYYYYPPLFHIAGGLWILAFGAHAFCFLNLFFTAALLVSILAGCRSAGPPPAGRWAVLLCVSNAWLAFHAVRLYVETLTTLLAVGAFLLVLAVRRAPATRNVVALGVVTGLALLAKNSSLALLALLLGLAAVLAVRRERAHARAYAIAAAVALAVAAPMFVRNVMFYGSPVYPAFARDLDPLLYAMNKSTFTPRPGAFYAQTAHYTGVLIGLMVLAAFAFAAIRRKGSFELGLLGFCAALYVMGPLQPLLDARHMLPVIGAAAVLSSILVARELERWKRARAAITAALLVLAATSVVRMPHYRELLDASAESIAAFEAVRDRVPEGETVLSRETYDTWYYSGRAATWPIPWGQREHPVEMFLTSDCDSVMLALRRHRLDYLLVSRVAQGERFTGANYPRPFLTCMGKLIDQRRLEVLWSSASMALLRVAPP